MSMFRKEVLDNKKGVETIGQILVTQPLKLRVYMWGLMAAGLGTFLLLTLGSYVPYYPAKGRIVALDGETRLLATRAGVIAQVYVSEGMAVQKGKRLVSVSTDAVD